MIILDLKFKKNKKTVDVTLEDGQILNLTSESLVKFSIYKGANVLEDNLKCAIEESDKEKALEKAMIYLSKGYRSEKELKMYLVGKKYSNVIQNYVIDKLKNYNYIDDNALANQYVQFSSKKMGINKIKQKLYEKGIKKTIIEENLQQIDNQYDICLELAQKKWASIMKSQPSVFENSQEEYKYNQNLRAKLSRYLYSQGFDWDTIKSVIQNIIHTNDDF